MLFNCCTSNEDHHVKFEEVDNEHTGKLGNIPCESSLDGMPRTSGVDGLALDRAPRTSGVDGLFVDKVPKTSGVDGFLADQTPSTSGAESWVKILCDGLSKAKDWIDCLHDDKDVSTHFFMTITKIHTTGQSNKDGNRLYEVALKFGGGQAESSVLEYTAKSTLSKGPTYHAQFRFTFDAPLQSQRWRSPGDGPLTLWGCLKGVPSLDGEGQSFPASPEKHVVMLCLRDSKGWSRRFQQKGGVEPPSTILASEETIDLDK